MLPFDVVERVDALLFEELPLRVVVLHVLYQLGHVDEAIPGVHHVLNNELDKADLALGNRARGPVARSRKAIKRLMESGLLTSHLSNIGITIGIPLRFSSSVCVKYSSAILNGRTKTEFN